MGRDVMIRSRVIVTPPGHHTQLGVGVGIELRVGLLEVRPVLYGLCVLTDTDRIRVYG